MLNWTFTVIFVLGFLILIVAEVVGIIRKQPGDTITEHWRWVDKKLHGFLQWGWRILTAGLLIWILLHLMSVSGGWQ